MSEEQSPYERKGPDFESAYESPTTPPAQSASPGYARQSPTPGPEPVAQPYVDPHHAQFQQQQVQPPPHPQQDYRGYQGYQQQPGYGYAGGWAPAPEHPRATTVLVLGILGFLFAIPAFFGWYMGGKAKKEIQQGANYRWDGALKVGYILSIVASILTIAGVVLYLFLILVLFAMLGTM
ncbi:MAG: hypothetical protein GX596_12195 [Propionibacterium sp.]|nr:hypothetical protein [Propionibacterium sp.]